MIAEWESRTSDFPKKAWYAHFFRSQLYDATYKFDRAVTEGLAALSQARILGDSVLVGWSYTQLGQAAENNNQQVPALTYFLIGEEVIKRFGNDRSLFKHYEELRDFYVRLGEIDEAYRTVELQSELIEKSDEFDRIDQYLLDYWKLYVSIEAGYLDDYLDELLNRIHNFEDQGYNYQLANT
ncbi:MAG: hypothetical protein J4F31_07035 [Flavobacteriales bacterium]|nr:hypothetical protein [Flavobacteriales bacterium]